MNERIRELMIQSNPHGDFKDCEWVFEKFAELIVLECAEFLRDLPDHGMHNYYKYAALKVQKHFGVEP